MDLDGLLHPETLERLRRAESGKEPGRRLRLGDLTPGQVGIIEATVALTAPPRTFQRRNGSEGLVGRVTLDDGTGEADLVLWDSENQHVRDGTLAVGARVRVRGALVKAGFRGGVELGLGKAVLEPIHADAATMEIRGVLARMEPTQVVDGRFQAEAVLEVEGAETHVMLWDDAIKAALALVGRHVVVAGASPHPLLDGWFLGDQATVQASP